MALIEGGVSAAAAGVGSESASALHITPKPIPYGALGHYRTAVRIASTAAQAANSRIFEIRNTHASNLIIPTRLRMRVLQTAAGTAQENSLDVYKVTAFSAVDTTNTVTPTTSVKRTSMAAYPGGAAVRHLTLAGAAAGMTGGTLTKDAQFFATLPYDVGNAIVVGGPSEVFDTFDEPNGANPFVFVQNEGIIIENRVLNVTSYGVTWYIDFSWCEATAY